MIPFVTSLVFAEPLGSSRISIDGSEYTDEQFALDIEAMEKQEIFRLEMLSTGFLGMAGTAQYYFPTLQLWDGQFSTPITDITSDYATLVQGDWSIVAKDRLPDVLSVLNKESEQGDNAPQCNLSPHKLGRVTATERVIVDQSTDEILAVEPDLWTVFAWKCTKDNVTFELLNFGGGSIEEMGSVEKFPSWTVNDFEFRPTMHLSVAGQSVDIIGRPMQELSRIYNHILEREGFYVDVGNFVHGYTSIEDKGFSKYRYFDYEWLSALEPFALGIGRNELIAGVDNFIKETHGMDLPYLATNLKAPEGYKGRVFPTHKIHTIEHETGNASTVLFLSILDPEWAEQVPQIKSEGWEILDPNESMKTLLASLEEEQNKPDAVVVLTSASTKVLQEIRQRGPSIDLLLGDHTLATHRISEQVIDLHEIDKTEKGAPLTLPMDGLQLVWLEIGNGFLQRLQHNVVDIYESDAVNSSVQRQIMDTRLPYYGQQNEQRLTLDHLEWNERLSQDDWELFLCGVVLERTGADTVLLDGFRPPKGIGTLTEKHISDALAVNDVVEIHRIPGKNYKRFLDQAKGATSASCGVKPGTGSPKPKGHAIETGMFYTVATTDQVRLRRGLGLLIQANQSSKWLDAPKMETLIRGNGEQLGLRSMILEAVREYDTAAATPSLKKVTEQTSTIDKQRWWLKLNDVGLTTDSFESPQVEELASVPETMINNPSSASLGTMVDVSLDYIAPKSKSTFRAQSQYSALYATVDEQEDLQKQETADDLRFTGTWSYTAADWTLGKLSVMPFGEVLMDAEWTPIELEDGSLATRQSDFSLTTGISTKPWRSIRNVKLGVLVNRDLAQLDTKPNEWAGSMQFTSSKSFSQALIWGNEGTMNIYGNTPDDDASDLRLRAYGKSKLTMPISSNFGVSFYATGLLVKGRSIENDVWGHGWNLGVSVDVLGTFSM